MYSKRFEMDKMFQNDNLMGSMKMKYEKNGYCEQFEMVFSGQGGGGGIKPRTP